MPLVEYVCLDCSTSFEILTGVTQDSEEAICPECGAKHVERSLSVFAAKSHGGDSPGTGFTPAASRCSPGCGCH